MVKGTEQSCYAQAEVLGTDRPCRGPLEFQRQRADIADDQTLTTGQYHSDAETPVFRPLVGLSSSEYARAWEGAYIYVCLKAQ